MTVNSHLTSTASELVLSSDENSSIKTSISTLPSRLNSWFGSTITSHFQFGSSVRGTILPRKADSRSDIDYMVVFDTSDGKKKPQTYLDRLRRFAENKYSTSEIKQSSPTLVLSLNHISFELVPAVYEYYSYQIPSPASAYFDWMATDPNGSNQALIDKNKSNNYLIKPLVRLVKYWNANNNYPYASYSLENYILDQYFYPNTSLKYLFYQFWSGFNYTYDTSQWIKDKVDLAKKRTANAKSYDEQDMPASALSEIKKVIPSL
jgi:predicted nucleotidyltransferase